MAEFDIDAIVEALNAAALEPTRWEAALELLVKKTHSFGSVIFPLRGSLPYVPATRSMDECFDVYVRDGWVNRDERLFRGTNKLMEEGLITDRDIISESAIKRSPYYQDFLTRINLRGYAAIRVGDGEHVWALTFHRTPQQDQYSFKELQSLRELSARLASTTQIVSALGLARGESALSAFDVAGKAALLLDRAGEVVRANAMAERLLDHDIKIVKRRLSCSDFKASDRFDQSIKRLLWSRDRAGVPPVSLPRSGRSPLIAYLMRSFQLADTPLSAYHAIVVLIDPDARLAPAMRTLQANLGLTPAEARLALALLAGDDLQTAALRLNVSLETVRKQVKSTFAKTSLRRQSELIAMLSNLVPGL